MSDSVAAPDPAQATGPAMRAHLYTRLNLRQPEALFADASVPGITGNTGNLVFAHAIAQMFATENRRIAPGDDLSALSAETDCLLMPLANHLGPHERRSADDVSQMHLPVVAVGLGLQAPITGLTAEAIPDSTWNWLEALIERRPRRDAPNIAIRGEATRSLFVARGLEAHCVVTGCPSNFLNPTPTLGREIHRRRANGFGRVAVAAGNPFDARYRRLEQSLIAVVEQTQGMYVCQGPADMLNLARLEYERIPAERFQTLREGLLPRLDDDGVLDWFRRYAMSFRSVPDWLAMLARFDLVIGARIHGVMAGLQAGVPSLCLCVDARMLELCEVMAIPHVDARDHRRGITLEQVTDLMREWDWRLYDDRRRMLAERFVRFANGNGLRATGPVRAVLPRGARRPATEAREERARQRHSDSRENRYPDIYSALVRAVESPVHRVLSFGCADGYEANDLAARHFLHAQVLACDVDEDAVRIARLGNRLPSRVRIEHFDPEVLAKEPAFDLIVAMSVLCRWPESRNVGDLSTLYPFTEFDALLGLLVSRLRPGGVLCVYNANYRVMQSSSAGVLEPLAALERKEQPVRLFDRDGSPSESAAPGAVLFRKIRDEGSGA